jgi:hypothetical protein
MSLEFNQIVIVGDWTEGVRREIKSANIQTAARENDFNPMPRFGGVHPDVGPCQGLGLRRTGFWRNGL